MNVQTGKRKKKWVYYGMLGLMVLLWGIDPTVNASFYRYYSASILTAIQTFASALFFWLLFWKKGEKLSWQELKIALPISLLNSVGCLLQRIGLQYTTPSNYAFLEHISCVVVPVAMFLLVRQKPSRWQVLASVLCLTGCFLLSGIDFETNRIAFGIGEILCCSAGLLYGTSLAMTGVYGKQMNLNVYISVHMTVYFLVAVFMAVGLSWFKVNGVPLETPVFSAEPLRLLFLFGFGLLSVGIGWLLRTEAARNLEPTVVAVVSPFSAVIASVVSVCCGMDELTGNLLIGSTLILVAALISGVADTYSENAQEIS